MHRLMKIPGALSLLRILLVGAAVLLFLDGAYIPAAAALLVTILAQLLGTYMIRRCDICTDRGVRLHGAANCIAILLLVLTLAGVF